MDHDQRSVLPASGPLTGLVVLELDDGLAQYCGKMLADMGAEVIKIEPPEGAPSRHIPPFYRDTPGFNNSLSFWHYNTNKRSVVLDLETADARTLFRLLVRRADIVLDGLEPGRMERWQLGSGVLRTSNPRLIYARVTPFGTTGPWAHFKSSDLVQLALGGTMAMSGYDDLDGDTSYPIGPSGGQVAHMTGVMTTIAAMAALNDRESTGAGQDVDVAAHDVIAASNEMGIPYWVFQRRNVYRHTARHANVRQETPRQMFRCRDGKYAMCLTTYMSDDKRFRALVEWFASRGLAEDLGSQDYLDAGSRAARTDHIIDVIERFCAQTDSIDVFHGAQARKLPWGPVNGPWDLLTDPHLRHDRQVIVEVEHRELGETFAYPGAPYQFQKTPWSLRRVAPQLGVDTQDVLREASLSAESQH